MWCKVLQNLKLDQSMDKITYHPHKKEMAKDKSPPPPSADLRYEEVLVIFAVTDKGLTWGYICSSCPP